MLFDRDEDRIDFLGLQDDCQHAVLEAVVAENIRERGCNHGTETEIRQRPHGVLARRSAAEVRAGYQDIGLLEARLLQYELTIGLIPPIEKKPRAEPTAHDRLEKLL